LKLRII